MTAKCGQGQDPNSGGSREEEGRVGRGHVKRTTVTPLHPRTQRPMCKRRKKAAGK